MSLDRLHLEGPRSMNRGSPQVHSAVRRCSGRRAETVGPVPAFESRQEATILRRLQALEITPACVVFERSVRHAMELGLGDAHGNDRDSPADRLRELAQEPGVAVTVDRVEDEARIALED